MFIIPAIVPLRFWRVTLAARRFAERSPALPLRPLYPSAEYVPTPEDKQYAALLASLSQNLFQLVMQYV